MKRVVVLVYASVFGGALLMQSCEKDTFGPNCDPIGTDEGDSTSTDGDSTIWNGGGGNGGDSTIWNGGGGDPGDSTIWNGGGGNGGDPGDSTIWNGGGGDPTDSIPFGG